MSPATPESPARSIKARAIDADGAPGQGLTAARFMDNVEYREESGKSASGRTARSRTLTVALMGAEPQTRSLPAADSLAGLLDAFAAAVDGGKPFPVSTAEMLDVVGAFEAVIGSIAAGVPVKVARNGRAG